MGIALETKSKALPKISKQKSNLKDCMQRVCVHACYGTCDEVRGQFCDISLFLPPFLGLWGHTLAHTKQLEGKGSGTRNS